VKSCLTTHFAVENNNDDNHEYLALFLKCLGGYPDFQKTTRCFDFMQSMFNNERMTKCRDLIETCVSQTVNKYIKSTAKKLL